MIQVWYHVNDANADWIPIGKSPERFSLSFAPAQT
jgi:hypothetical protein